MAPNGLKKAVSCFRFLRWSGFHAAACSQLFQVFLIWYASQESCQLFQMSGMTWFPRSSCSCSRVYYDMVSWNLPAAPEAAAAVPEFLVWHGCQKAAGCSIYVGWNCSHYSWLLPRAQFLKPAAEEWMVIHSELMVYNHKVSGWAGGGEAVRTCMWAMKSLYRLTCLDQRDVINHEVHRVSLCPLNTFPPSPMQWSQIPHF